MESFWTELKLAWRNILAQPGFAILVLIPLSLGIGSNTAIFSAVYSVLLRSLPYQSPESLVRVWEARPRMGPMASELAAFSLDHYRQWRDANDVFDGMAVYQTASFNWSGNPASASSGSSSPRRLEGQRVSPELFSVLGVDPLLGRVFSEDEEIPGRDRVVVLSSPTWRRWFGSDPNVVGQTVLLNGQRYHIVGIMPEEFRFPDASTELWAPLALAPVEPARPGEMRLELVPVIARLAPGVTVEQAEASAEVFLSHSRGESEMERRMSEGVSIHLTSLHEQLVRPVRPALLVLLAAVGCVLLIACANVTNLLLVRAQSRERELAVRAALGSGRAGIVRKLLAESLLYSLLGGALGIGIAYASVSALKGLAPADLELVSEIGLNRQALAFNVVVAVATALLVGLIPALKSSRVDLVQALKGAGGTGDRTLMARRPQRLRNLFAILEVAVALVLLVGAGLLIRSFIALTQVDPGYVAQDVITFRLELPENKYPDATARRAFFDRLRESLEGISSVSASGLVSTLPLDQERTITAVHVEGRPEETDRSQMPRASVRIVSPGFLSAMGMRLLEGRDFEEADSGDAPRVVVVNQSLVDRFFEGESAVGRRLRGLGEIVGVVADVRQEGLDAEPEPEILVSYRQLSGPFAMQLQSLNVAVRYAATRDGAELLIPALRAAVARIDPELPMADVRPMRERLRDSIARPRLYAALLISFAALALVLAVSGVYSVISVSVTQRTQETGVRMALGATAVDVIRLVLKDGAALLVVGLGLGWGMSFALGRFLENMLFRVHPTDPLTLILMSAGLGLAVLAACSVPAMQASRTDVIRALRYE